MRRASETGTQCCWGDEGTLRGGPRTRRRGLASGEGEAGNPRGEPASAGTGVGSTVTCSVIRASGD